MIEHIIRKFNPNVCYDIGAHDGSFSQLLHRILPLATIHQFEGSPNKFQKVKWATWHKVLLSDFVYSKKIKDHLRNKKILIQHDYFFSKEPLE